MTENYGISEIARELGISRQRTHQKVKQCRSPYIKYPSRRPSHMVAIVSKATVPGWLCPKCGHPNPTYKAPEERKAMGFVKTAKVLCISKGIVYDTKINETGTVS